MALLTSEFLSLEIGQIRYLKIENFMLIYKMPTQLSDKIHPKKLNKNKEMGLGIRDFSF
jgi:hypothetical protein